MTRQQISVCSYCGLRKMCVSHDNVNYVCNTCGTRLGMTPNRMNMYLDREATVLEVETPKDAEPKEATPDVMEKRARLYKK